MANDVVALSFRAIAVRKNRIGDFLTSRRDPYHKQLPLAGVTVEATFCMWFSLR